MKTLNKLNTKTKREAFVRAHIQNGLAHQIRLLRKERNWSQAKLAKKIGLSNQSAIARLENPAYGRYSTSTLLKIADAFDVAALVKFVSFSKLIEETSDVSPAALTVPSYEQEGNSREATMRSVGLPTYDQFINLELNVTPHMHARQSTITLYADQAESHHVARG